MQVKILNLLYKKLKQ